MFAIIERVNGFVWGVPLVVLILGTGLAVTFACGFPQIRLFPDAVRAFCRQFTCRGGSDGSSSYRALCTALAATVGTGNLAGVAGAIAIGGPGAVFWIWVCAIVGMATKFAEATLAVYYQRRRADGTRFGGPMYMILQGLGKKWHWLAYVYAFFCIIASFGVGNVTQINAIMGGLRSAAGALGYEISDAFCALVGIGLAGFILMVLSGGAKRVGDATEKLVPVMSVGYLVLCALVLIMKIDMIPAAFASIIQGAFTPSALTGGAVGSLLITLRIGAARGVFTNEAGMGTAAIAHGASCVEHPVRQGFMGIIEVFLDTIVICTMTGLVILCSGVDIQYGRDVGVELTAWAFSKVCGDWVSVPLSAALLCFAVATILGWGLYGASCAQFLFGDGAWKKIIRLQAAFIVIGAVMNTATVWLLADIINGLMAIPNLVTLLLLLPVLSKLVRDYKRKRPATGRRGSIFFQYYGCAVRM